MGLGSNQGDGAENLRKALEEIRAEPGIRVVAVSSFHETDPVGDPDQPRFTNACALLSTDLAPRVLLDRLLAIETRLGRVRDPARRWGPRVIDLDLLCYGEMRIREEGLEVPHPRMGARSFVLKPLAEIAPDLVT